MNIFILDKNIDRCAQQHNDKHCVKMIVETAQLLSTAHHVLDSPVASQLYRKTHVNHPCAIWIRESKANYEWAYNLFVALCKEYYYRYEKMHKTFREKAIALGNIPDGIPDIGLTPFKQCMPDECKDDDAITAYRNYYMTHKRHIASWKKRDVPAWYS